MNKLFCFATAALVLALSTNAASQDKNGEKRAVRTLDVKVDYRGAGTVDQKHPILLFVFDSPDFVNGGVMPIGGKSVTASKEVVHFTDLQASPVYVVAAYDPSGGYDGQSGPPPSGSSMGLYATQEGKPKPVAVEPGQKVAIDLVFDDAAKMP